MKRSFRFIASLMILAGSPASAQPIGSATSETWLANAFTILCFAPFGDENNVKSAIEAFQPTQFTKIKPAATGTMVGTTWESPKSSITYVSAEWLPRDLPSPQCTLGAELGADFDHAATVALLQAELPIGEGRTTGKKGRQSTQWNFVGPDGERRRIFLSSELGGTGIQAKLSLLNLRK